MSISIFKSIQLNDFTAFSEINLPLSDGINIFMGQNSTGKTHLLKLLYASASITVEQGQFADRIVQLFSPNQDYIGRLVRRGRGRHKASVKVEKTSGTLLSIDFSTLNKVTTSGERSWSDSKIQSAFIPVKEMLSHAPGFRSLFRERDIAFDKTYVDIIDLAFKPQLRGPMDDRRSKLMMQLQKGIGGKVFYKDEIFYHKSKSGAIEFPLLSEGFRKIGLLMQLVQNGTLTNGSALFWDEPEANLNPKLIRLVAEVLLELKRLGVQIFVATHSYSFLQLLNLIGRKDVDFHLFKPGKSREDGVSVQTSEDFLDFENEPISEAYYQLFKDTVSKKVREFK